MDDLPTVEVAFGPTFAMAQILSDDLLTESTDAIRVRGPKGCAYARCSFGVWKEISAKELRTRKGMGLA